MKEEKQASSSKTFSAEEKLDEMSNLLKHLASKMLKMELENHATQKPIQEGNNKNLTPFRRPFQPQKKL